MNIFQIPANDQSVFYLGRIFGYVGAMLPLTGPSAMLGAMFKTFNTIALTVGVLVVVYTTVVGLLATAHEGEFMGKKWSGLWVPIRTLLGIAALFPTGTGYSALQVIMMWVILQGVGAADALWTTALTYVQVAGSPFTKISDTNLNPEKIKEQMKKLFQGLTCQATAKKKTAGYYCNRATDAFCNDTDILNITGSKTSKIDGSLNQQYQLGPNDPAGPCGTLTFGDPTKVQPTGPSDPSTRIKYATYQAQQQALQNVVSTLGGVANSFADYDADYLQFYLKTGVKPSPWLSSYCAANNISNDQCCVNTEYATEESLAKNMHLSPPYPHASPCRAQSAWEDPFFIPQQGQPPDWTNAGTGLIENIMWPYAFSNLAGSDFIKASTDYYISSINVAITTATQQFGPGLVDDWAAKAQSYGWIMAGAFYYKLAALPGGGTGGGIVPPIAMGSKDGKDIPAAPMLKIRNNYQAASVLMAKSAPPSGISSYTGVASQLDSGVKAGASGIVNDWMGYLTGKSEGSAVNTNPLLDVRSFGEALITWGEVLFSIFAATAILLAGFLNLSVFALGSGVVTGLGSAAMMAAFIFLPIIFALVTALYVLGGTLAVYVPLIPFIIFTMAAMGWIIATIETMIAAPLVAIGMLSPGGQHEIFGRAEPAIMLLLNVFLRPSLMIFGLIAAMLFATVGVSLVNATFKAAMGYILNPSTSSSGSPGASNPGVTVLILFIAAYVFLIIAVLNKCFSLIHLIPERVMTWIGGQAVSYGEGEALGEVKRGTEAAGGAVAGAGKGAVGHAQQVGAKQHGKGKLDDKLGRENVRLGDKE